MRTIEIVISGEHFAYVRDTDNGDIYMPKTNTWIRSVNFLTEACIKPCLFEFVHDAEQRVRNLNLGNYAVKKCNSAIFSII